MLRWLVILLTIGLCSSLSGEELARRLRRPVTVAQSRDQQRLLVANRDSGSLTTIDLAAGRAVREVVAGRRMSDLASVPGTERFVALDESSHEALLLEEQAEQTAVRQRLAVAPYPVSVAVAEDGQSASIASLWSRRLTFVELSPLLRVSAVIDLPFAPRCQLRLPARDRLLVADSFGGQIAIVEWSSRRLLQTLTLPAHNIRGLGLSADGQMLLVSHQMLNELAHSIHNDIHWGLLLSNDLRWLKVDSVLAGGEELYRGAHMHPLGNSGRGGGDPGGLAVAPDGTVVVAISGVSEIALGREDDFAMQRFKAPRRPTTVRISGDGRQAFVVNTLDDSVSVIDLAERKLAATISLGPTPELSLAERGELLFYDARLSHDGWMSCHSCHTDGHANGQKNDNFSDKTFGAPKRVLSLLGVKDTLPLAWTGQVQTLARQVRNSVQNTMQSDDSLPASDAEAIAAFVETLEPPPPLARLRGTEDRGAIARGRLVFERRQCATCHAPPSYTSTSVYDVGLTDALGTKEFNPPSLRGISQRASFFHDGRVGELAEVFQAFGHPGESTYSADEVSDLTAFLNSL